MFGFLSFYDSFPVRTNGATVSFADVESANIVGYSTYTAQKGFNLCAVNFKNIGEKEDFPIINLFPGIGNGVEYKGLNYKGSIPTGADYMMVSVGPGSTEYNMYFLYYNSKTGGSNNYRWFDASKNQPVTGNILPQGRGMWFVRQGKGDITFDIKKQF